MNLFVLSLISLNLFASEIATGRTYHYLQDTRKNFDLAIVDVLELTPYAIYCENHKSILRSMEWFRTSEDKKLTIKVDWTYFYRMLVSATNLDPLMTYTATGTFDSLINCLKEKMPHLKTIKINMEKVQTDLVSVKKLLTEYDIQLEEYTEIDLKQ